jgi:hypothetical protein
VEARGSQSRSGYAIIPIELDGTIRIYAEARIDDMQTRALVSSGVQGRFADVVAAIKGVAKNVKEAVQDASPDEVEVEFGVDIKVEPSGIAALIVSGDLGATMKVTLKWSKPAAG